MRELSIYIHIPFCVRKCLYCDFLSFPVSEACGSGRLGGKGCDMESYVNLLEREIVREAEKYRNHQVISVFWGGGTPSLLEAAAVTRIMGTLRRCYQMAADAEITIETNPGTVTAEKLAEYITAGINRLSIGLQSADDGELARIGRIHDYRTFLETYGAAREAGFRNINIDLMAALPGQSVASYRETLQKAAALEPEHISAYSLILEEGTPLYEKRQDYRFPTEEEDREMYLLTEVYLSACGYHRYEISNYAREGYECRHNKVYWQRGDYAGFGLGAASMVRNVRWSNPTEVEWYAKAVLDGSGREVVQGSKRAEAAGEVAPDSKGARAAGEVVEGSKGARAAGKVAEGGKGAGAAGMVASDGKGTEKAVEGEPAGRCGTDAVCRQVLTVQEQMEEFMFLGLRMVCGVSCEKFAGQFGRRIEEVYGAVIEKLCGQGLLLREAGRIRLTKRGLDVSNYVMAEFLL